MSDETTIVPNGSDVIRPGNINVQMVTGHTASGCALIEFIDTAGSTASEQMMSWSNAYKNMLVVDLKYATDTTGKARILVTYTSVLSTEQLAEIQEVDQLVQSQLAQLRARRAQAKLDHAAAVTKAVDDTKRLAELGRVHEANCQKFPAKGKKGGR